MSSRINSQSSLYPAASMPLIDWCWRHVEDVARRITSATCAHDTCGMSLRSSAVSKVGDSLESEAYRPPNTRALWYSPPQWAASVMLGTELSVEELGGDVAKAIVSRGPTQRALVRVGLRVVLARVQHVPPRLHTGRRKRCRGRGAGGAHGVRPPADEGVGSCGRVRERARARTVAFGVHGAWERRRTHERAKALPARGSLMNPRRAVIQGGRVPAPSWRARRAETAWRGSRTRSKNELPPLLRATRNLH